MKKSLTLVAAAVMAFAANAQDLVVFTNGSNPNLEVIQDARLDPLSMNIGNTGVNTVVCIGEVDFSENYQAAGLAFAQGWGGNGNFALLWAGEDFESALPFTQIALAHTRSYSNYTKLAGNMGYNVTDPADLAGGRLATEGLSFYKPEGKQKVYLTFVGGAGNVQAVHFYKNAFTPADFHAPGDWEPLNGQLLKPNENMRTYGPAAMRLAYANSALVESPNADTRKDGDGGWGWTTNGTIVDYGTMDFGNGEYTQVCTYVNHWSNNKSDKVEFYLDEVAEENLIASIFTGMELRDQLYPKAKALTQTVTGSHKVLVKWVGGSTNITDVDFVKGNLWLETPDPDYAVMTVINETPSENAKWYTMRNDVPEGATKIQNHAAINQAQPDGGGNYGWTNSKSVIKFGGIDFENGQYNRAILGYATGNDGWIDYKDFANISLYLDLEADGKTYDWNNAHEALADVEPVAVIRHQATGGWGNVRNIGDELARVTGVHDVYLVYYQKYTNEGANIFDLFLDTQVPAKEPKITGISIKGQALELVEGQTEYSMTLTEDFTAEDVVVETEDAEDLVLSITKEDAPLKEVNEYVVTVELLDAAGAPVVAYTVNVTVDTTTGINDINVNSAKVVKMIENGQVVIVKGDKKFNAAGQAIK
ncbi:MAG: carbohydrate-binding protein [Bacteroidales bacterium]|nr:carbohydrate-binding protein [Candidatus Sodaliphilus limicaballi]